MNDTKKLYRSREDRMVFGLCGGLGEYFEVDPVLVRIIFVFVTFAGGAGILAYLIMSFIVPLAPGGENITFKNEAKDFAKKMQNEAHELKNEIKTERRKRHSGFGMFLGLVLIVVGVGWFLNRLGPFYGWYFRGLWPLIVILFGVYLVLRRRKQ